MDLLRRWFGGFSWRNLIVSKAFRALAPAVFVG